MKILLVEDSRIVQKVTLRMLNRLGYMSHAVGSGEAACAAMQDCSQQVVLMDLDLPGFGGLEAAKIIREQHPPQSPLWIIALTGWPRSAIDPYLGHGIDDHLAKPLRLETLQQALDRAELYLQSFAGSAAVS